ncbi:hypothetical protein PR048_000059 [Dryococelus australis]|uniref:C2H2-type domain-containing protein n=1 Tax=Dryococelus australis TaxID=614101 RepID=A0ABQ9IDK3_9NEOP|nr:hypothetical protein PR048_000059 [Dryococelus australis]
MAERDVVATFSAGHVGVCRNVDRKKQHVCHVAGCSKVYGKTSHLRAHLRWHSGDRPFICNWLFCGKRFTRSDELQVSYPRLQWKYSWLENYFANTVKLSLEVSKG